MKNVTLRQLKIFEAVARHLSFSRAAEELHLTQPAVSMQVQALEDLAGLPLTEQAGKKVQADRRRRGSGAPGAAHRRAVARGRRSLAALKGVESGKLKIGVVSTAKYFAPSLLAEFRRRHPGVDIQLTVNNRGAPSCATWPKTTSTSPSWARRPASSKPWPRYLPSIRWYSSPRPAIRWPASGASTRSASPRKPC
jgi:hypothetical protein